MTLKEAFASIRNLMTIDDSVHIQADCWSHAYSDDIRVKWCVCVLIFGKKAERFEAQTLDAVVAEAVAWIGGRGPLDETAQVDAQVASVA